MGAEEAKVVAAPLNYYAGYPYAGYGYAGLPYAAAPAVTYAAATAPVAAPVAPVTYAAPIAPYVGSQFHAQDEFGNLNYGYSNLNSAKAEAGNTYGGVSGGYSYVDANGVLQQVQYVADAAGFRVADSRLPWPRSTTVLPPPSTPSSPSLPWTLLRLLRPRPPRRPLSPLSLRGRRGRPSPPLPTDSPPTTPWPTPLTTATPMPMPVLVTTATDSPTTDEQ